MPTTVNKATARPELPRPQENRPLNAIQIPYANKTPNGTSSQEDQKPGPAILSPRAINLGMPSGRQLDSSKSATTSSKRAIGYVVVTNVAYQALGCSRGVLRSAFIILLKQAIAHWWCHTGGGAIKSSKCRHVPAVNKDRPIFRARRNVPPIDCAPPLLRKTTSTIVDPQGKIAQTHLILLVDGNGSPLAVVVAGR